MLDWPWFTVVVSWLALTCILVLLVANRWGSWHLRRGRTTQLSAYNPKYEGGAGEPLEVRFQKLVAKYNSLVNHHAALVAAHNVVAVRLHGAEARLTCLEQFRFNHEARLRAIEQAWREDARAADWWKNAGEDLPETEYADEFGLGDEQEGE